MPINFTWDINPAAMIALIGGGVTVIAFWIRSSDVAKRANQLAESAEREVREARRVADEASRLAKSTSDSAERAHEQITILQGALTAHQLTQAERLVSREVLREVEDRLAGSIEKLGDRLDALVREIVKERRGMP